MRVLSSVLLALVIAASGCGTGSNGDDCTPNARTVCKDGVVYWVDSCGNQGDKAGDCDCGCNADFTACKDPCDCVPDCSGKECGPNGCGGTCAPGCDAGETCNEVTGQCDGGCVPSCTGKCCGEDGCGSTCPDNCGDTGQTCNLQTCQCEGVCQPDCQGKECGSNGCGGECPPGCQQGESCSAEGQCVGSECGGTPLTIQGTLNTGVADVGFDQVVSSFVHKRDIDEFEDGCIVTVDVSLTYSSGCQFHVIAGNQINQNGSYVIQGLEFQADSLCPNFPDPTEGTYRDTGGLTTAEVEVGVTEVPGYNVATSCVATYVTIRLQGSLNRVGDASSLSVPSTAITVTGDFFSTGNAGVVCPCVRNCQGKQCGDDGCGGSCGTCPGATEYCSANGQCVDDCAGRQCGPSPNEGFDCGTCSAGKLCASGICVDVVYVSICADPPHRSGYQVTSKWRDQRRFSDLDIVSHARGVRGKFPRGGQGLGDGVRLRGDLD